MVLLQTTRTFVSMCALVCLLKLILSIVFDSHRKYFSQLVVWDFGGQLWPLGAADPILVLITTDPSTLLCCGHTRSVQLRGSSLVVSTQGRPPMYRLYHPIVQGSISETALSAAQSKSINLWSDLCWGGRVVSSSAEDISSLYRSQTFVCQVS